MTDKTGPKKTRIPVAGSEIAPAAHISEVIPTVSVGDGPPLVHLIFLRSVPTVEFEFTPPDEGQPIAQEHVRPILNAQSAAQYAFFASMSLQTLRNMKRDVDLLLEKMSSPPAEVHSGTVH